MREEEKMRREKSYKDKGKSSKQRKVKAMEKNRKAERKSRKPPLYAHPKNTVFHSTATTSTTYLPRYR